MADHKTYTPLKIMTEFKSLLCVDATPNVDLSVEDIEELIGPWLEEGRIYKGYVEDNPNFGNDGDTNEKRVVIPELRPRRVNDNGHEMWFSVNHFVEI